MENKGLSCFLETIAPDDWVRSLGGRMLGRPENGRGGSLREPSRGVGGVAGA